jgi:uroporphyrinogen-III synthase
LRCSGQSLARESEGGDGRPGRREELEHRGFRGVIAPESQADSEALLALPELQRVKGWRVVIFRGDSGRQLLGEDAGKRGAIVEYAACYRRVRPPGAGLAAAWSHGVDAVTISSSEGLANVIEMLGEGAAQKLGSVALFVPHARVARKAARRGP